MQALYNKKTIFIITLTAFLTACGGTGGGVKETPQGTAVDGKTSVSEAAANPVKGAPSSLNTKVKQDYQKALDAMKAGDEAKAEALLRHVSVTNPELSGPHVNLGLIKFRAGKTEAAEAQFKKAIELNPESAVSYNHMGIISRSRGEFPLARTYYQKALTIDPSYAFAHLNFGILLDIYIGDLDQALAHYKRFQELNGEEDQDVRKWIIELQRRIKKAK
ncbi:MAG: tetratricopeptide repeat protein [Thiohalomonadales bacterium]